MRHYYFRVFLSNGEVEEVDAKLLYIDSGNLMFIDNTTDNLLDADIVVVYARNIWDKVLRVVIKDTIDE